MSDFKNEKEKQKRKHDSYGNALAGDPLEASISKSEEEE